MNLPILDKQDENTFQLQGVLTMQTVNSLVRESRDLLSNASGNVSIDFAQVERADSAGLVLLIEWLRLAQRKGFTLTFRNLPEQLMQIARVSELDKVLPLEV